MKKVLVIAYYWPPAGGGGVQRWLKFTRYLPEFGWDPIVFAPDNADYPLRDETLEAEVPPNLEVIRRPILEPRKIYKRLMDRKARERPEGTDEVFYRPKEDRSFKQNLSLWIRGNLFIPDARVLWVRPSVKWLAAYLKEKPVDVVVTTGPPHSLHLIGRGLKRRLGLPWVADFRDPWTDIEFYDNLMLSRFADRLHRRLEQSVFSEADHVVDVSPYWEHKIKAAGGRNVTTITNGFDPSDFPTSTEPLAEKFQLSHLGTLSLDRNPLTLWESLRNLSESVQGFREDMRVELVGKTDPAVFESAKAYGLSDRVVDGGYVTHSEAIRKMQTTQILLLLVNQSEQNAPGRMTGKIFEYLAAGRPILLIGPSDGDAARLLAETKTGIAVDFGDTDTLAKALAGWYASFRTGSLAIDSPEVNAYTRRNLAGKLASVLDEVV
jgi:glycosyltransferase involved in cell wall biosynthesis